MLPEPAALLALVAEELREGEPPDRLLEPIGPRRHHPRKRRRHLRPQGDRAISLVHEIVELPDDLVAGLRGVQLERLEGGTVVFLETVPRGHASPSLEDVRPKGEILGIEVTKAREGALLHGRKCNRHEDLGQLHLST